MSKHIIPTLLAVFDLAEAAVCVCQKDYARAMYWASAASITISTIMMKG